HPKVALVLIGLNDVDRTDLSAYERETIRTEWSFAAPAAVVKSLAAYSELASTLLNLGRGFQAYQRGLATRPVDLRALELLNVHPDALEHYVRRRGVDDVTGVDLARVRANRSSQSGAMYWRPLELYNDALRRIGQERSVLVVDLARRLKKSSAFFYDFTHFTV